MCPMSQETETDSTHKSTLFIWNKCYSLHSYSFCNKKKVHSFLLFFMRIWIISCPKSITSNISVDFNEQQAIDSLIYALVLWWDVIRDKDIEGGVGWESVPAQDCMLSLVLSLTQQLREEHQVDNPGAAALQKQAYSWTWEDLFCRGKKAGWEQLTKTFCKSFPQIVMFPLVNPPTFSQRNSGRDFRYLAEEGGVLWKILCEAFQSHSVARILIRYLTFAFELIFCRRSRNICVNNQLFFFVRPRKLIAINPASLRVDLTVHSQVSVIFHAHSDVFAFCCSQQHWVKSNKSMCKNQKL